MRGIGLLALHKDEDVLDGLVVRFGPGFEQGGGFGGDGTAAGTGAIVLIMLVQGSAWGYRGCRREVADFLNLFRGSEIVAEDDNVDDVGIGHLS